MQPELPANVNESPLRAFLRPYLTSRTIAGILLTVLPGIAKHFGYTLDDRLTQDTVEFGFQMFGGALALWGRIHARGPLPGGGASVPEIRRAIPVERADSGGTTPALLAVITAAFAAAILLFPGCASDTARGRVTNQVLLTAAKFAGRVLITSVSQLASDHARGLQLDYAHAASAGLWTNAESIFTSDDLTRVVNAYAGPAPAPLAAPLAAQWDAAQPRTPGDRTALVAGMATGISDAALALKTFRGFVPSETEKGLAK